MSHSSDRNTIMSHCYEQWASCSPLNVKLCFTQILPDTTGMLLKPTLSWLFFHLKEPFGVQNNTLQQVHTMYTYMYFSISLEFDKQHIALLRKTV